jgi:Trk K+ transport system NAD-binding subunit
VRRRIVMLLMIARSAGVVTIVISLILSFAGTQSDISRLYRLLWVLGGVGLLLLAGRVRWIDRVLNRMINWALRKWTNIDTHDYTSLLNLSGGYAVTEIFVRRGEWLKGKTLKECRLPDEGVTVLGIHRRNGDYIGVPRGDTKIFSGDTLILYGRSKALKKLESRRADQSGEKDHEEAVDEQKREEAVQTRKEQMHEREYQSN